MYVAVKGKYLYKTPKRFWQRNVEATGVFELTLDQIKNQLSLSVDRVMAEGSLYDRDLAALAIKQARGDIVEAIFLLRAYRTTLLGLRYSSIDTAKMQIRRRVSATFKGYRRANSGS